MRAAPFSLLFALAISVASVPVHSAWSASINAGDRQAEAELPFTVTSVAEFNTPWAIAFLPDGRLVVTEKP